MKKTTNKLFVVKQKATLCLRFGDGVKNKSIKTANISIIIGWKKMFWVVDVIKDDILLLVQCQNWYNAKIADEIDLQGKWSSNQTAV